MHSCYVVSKLFFRHVFVSRCFFFLGCSFTFFGFVLSFVCLQTYILSKLQSLFFFRCYSILQYFTYVLTHFIFILRKLFHFSKENVAQRVAKKTLYDLPKYSHFSPFTIVQKLQVKQTQVLRSQRTHLVFMFLISFKSIFQFFYFFKKEH